MRNPSHAAAIVLAAFFIFDLQLLLAQKPQLTVRVIAIVDYPGSGNSTTVQGINDRGDVTGYFEDSSKAIRSFIRYADGTFSAPIVEPNDTGNVTVAKDINNLGDICGYFFISDFFHPYRGFILSDSTFTEYGTLEFDYYLSGITDAGDFCATRDYSDFSEGSLVVNGQEVVFTVGNFAEANAINVHTGIVGDYDDGTGAHGYLRETEFPFARIHFPVDYPGSTETYLLGVNDGGRIVVGKYVDSLGSTHGLILQRPDKWTSFDYPGAVETSLNGVNNNKVVSGYYADSSGIHHGFIGKVHESASR